MVGGRLSGCRSQQSHSVRSVYVYVRVSVCVCVCFRVAGSLSRPRPSSVLPARGPRFSGSWRRWCPCYGAVTALPVCCLANCLWPALCWSLHVSLFWSGCVSDRLFDAGAASVPRAFWCVFFPSRSWRLWVGLTVCPRTVWCVARSGRGFTWLCRGSIHFCLAFRTLS